LTARPVALAWLTALATVAAATACGQDSLDMKPGLWKTRTYNTVEVEGMPRMPARSRASQQCVTGEPIDPTQLFDAEQGCSVEDRAMADGVLTFRMTCPAEQGQMTGHARYEADGETGSGHLEMKFVAGGIVGKVVIDMKTKRVGDC
jgi:hypothetical protein